MFRYHIEQGRPNTRERRRLRQTIRVDRKNIPIRQSETNRVIPVAPQLVLPLLCVIVEFNYQSNLWRPQTLVICGWSGVATGTGRPIVDPAGLVRIKTITQHRFKDGRRLVTGLEPCNINRSPVRADSECPRGICEKCHDSERPAAERSSQICRIEDPRIRSSNTGGGKLRIPRTRDTDKR